MKRIIRVFTKKTSYTPTDDLVFIGAPPEEALPEHDEVHISCVFTWDRGYCEILRDLWEGRTAKPVLLGGPAYDDPADTFTPELYVRNGVVFTTRGCNNACSFCCVPRREGQLKELPVTPGNIIQDNNFLQASKAHKEKVFDMLRSQRGICFKGGLECGLIDDHFVSNTQMLRIKELWIACDTPRSLTAMHKAVEKLKAAGFGRSKIYCYVLCGDGDMGENEERCREVYKAGAMPFAQLYQPFGSCKVKYGTEWERFQRMWSRPAATKAHMEKGTNWWEF